MTTMRTMYKDDDAEKTSAEDKDPKSMTTMSTMGNDDDVEKTSAEEKDDAGVGKADDEGRG